MPIVVLAHGALGNFDELIFVSIAIIFVVMMAVSWFRSQQLDNEETNNTIQPDQADGVVTAPQSGEDHFTLE